MIRFRHPGGISKGIGKLTPDVWRGIVDAAFWVSKHSTQLESALRTVQAIKKERATRPWFLAQLTHAKRLENEANKYVYAWQRVQLKKNMSTPYDITATTGTSFNSTFDGDAYAYGAINLMEADNSQTYTAPGTDTSGSAYPDLEFFMNPIGGHPPHASNEPPRQTAGESVALKVNPIVQMWSVRNVEDGGNRYFFCASNAHDGETCN